MPLSKAHKHNLDELGRAFEHRRVAVLEAKRKADGKIVSLLVVVNDTDDGQFYVIPVAEMIDSSPYELYYPPDPNGGFLETD